jgi:cytochrome c553
MDVVERYAIWEVHGKRCAYCREHLLFRDMELDHVIPRTTANQPDIWVAQKRLHGLHAEFDIDSIPNRLPACGPCNNRKRDAPFSAELTQINLNKAKYLHRQVEERTARIRRQQNTDRTRINLINEIQLGNLSDEDIDRISAQARNEAGRFAVNPDGWLQGNMPLLELSRTDIDGYLDQAVNPNGDEGLELQGVEGTTQTVKTLREYEAAHAQGLYAGTNYGMSMEFLHFTRPLAILKYLRVARFAERSYISDPNRGLSDVALVPASLLYTVHDAFDPANRPAELAGQTVLDLVNRQTAKILSVGSHFLRIEFDGWITFLLELMRADVNGDGLEEMVVHRGGGPVDGTLRMANVLALTRIGPQALFSHVDDAAAH